MINAISLETIQSRFQHKSSLSVHFYEVIDSTNIAAKEYALQFHPQTLQVFIANQQTSGYGKQGRSFFSPKNQGIYMSIMLPNNDDFQSKPGLLTTGIAVTVISALTDTFPDANFEVKWVNDVYVDRRKCCGILTESFSAGKRNYVIIGIGININTVHFPDSIAYRSAAITDDSNVDRNLIIADILNKFVADFNGYKNGDHLETYRKLFMLKEYQIHVHVGNKNVLGIAESISQDGGLIVRNQYGQRQIFHSGEVTKVDF